ncbi:MAG TPA: 3-hydroxyacyl-ACP dehydratase [Caldimonas sp.]|jgi:3-hydroxymyristoyl/3-hydroxydecanoyl-(acyl carrier protein) dehydratase
MSDVVASFRIEVGSDHPAFAGHFPGRPVLPGVALLAAVLEAAAGEPTLARAVGAAPRLAVVKFLAPVEPGTSLAIAFRLGAGALDWQVASCDRPVASGRIARADQSEAGSA